MSITGKYSKQLQMSCKEINVGVDKAFVKI